MSFRVVNMTFYERRVNVMYNIEETFKNTNLMLNRSMNLITDSMSDIVSNQRSGMIELQNTYEQLLKLKNIEESI